MRKRFDAGSLLVAVGAIVLLVSLFLDWFSPGLSGWGAFEVADVLLAGLAAAAIAGALVEPSSSGERLRWLPVVCAAALLIVASQAIDAPPAASDERELGLWLALGAGVLMTLGAALAAARISVVVDVQGRDHRQRIAAVDRRDAPQEHVGAAEELTTVPLPAGVQAGTTQPFQAVAEPDPPQAS